MKEIVIRGWIQYHPDYEQVAQEFADDGTKISLYECLDEELSKNIDENNISEPEGSKKWKAVSAKLIILVED